MRRTRFRHACVSALVLLVAYAAVMVWAPAQAERAISLVLQAATALGSGIVCIVASRRLAGPARRGWLWIGCGCALWGLGAAIWIYYELGRGIDAPFPGVADFGYLGYTAMATAGAVAFQVSIHRAAAVRVTFDALIIAGSVLMISWYVALQAVYAKPAEGLLAQWLSLAYPVGDVVIVAILGATVLRAPRASRRPLLLLVVGVGSMLFADTGFAYLTTTDSFLSGGVFDVGWIAGFVFAGLAALASMEPTGESAASSEGMSRADVMVPYLPWTLAVCLTIRRALVDGGVDRFAVVLSAALLFLIVTRQLFTMLENVGLTRRLEATMADLVHREEYYRMLVQGSSDVITVLEPDGEVRYMSSAASRIFGWSSNELEHRSLTHLIHTDDVPAFERAFARVVADPGGVVLIEYRIRTRERGHITIETMLTSRIDEPSIRAVVCNTRDVSERKSFEKLLAHQAFHDPLTGLANRALFKDRLAHALTQRARIGREVAVLFLDLDGFKAVNDNLGHAGGDQVLCASAARLLACLRNAETVARFGGDEFAILLENLEGVDDAAEIADRCISAFFEPLAVLGRQVHVSTSIGIAVVTGEETAGDVLRNADLAMYRAKSLGKGRHEMYAPELHAAVVRRQSTEEELRRAIFAGELSLRYQPLVSLLDGSITGVEALVRWEHPSRKALLPSEFIAVAEESGLIVPLGRWVLEEATRTVAGWHADHPELILAVNVSARQLRKDDFDADVQAIVTSCGFPANRLTLEITESAAVDLGDATMDVLRRLRDAGIRLAIDDFGAGFSSINYLRRMPLDTLKVDMSYVAGLGIDQELTSLTKAIIAMAQSLGLATVAEGIETPQQLRLLLELGCRTGQGFLLGMPLTAEQMTRHLASTQQRPGPASALHAIASS